MSKVYSTTIITALAMIILFGILHVFYFDRDDGTHAVTVGFIYENDESTPYTYNFIRAENAVREQFGDRVSIIVKSNVPYDHTEEALQELVDSGCNLIFTTSFGYEETAKRFAGEYPDIQFCQATGDNANIDPIYPNYHTFMGEIYQGRYISGVVAGMKLREMTDTGEIRPEEAVVGYVAAYPYAEVISGYTAFLLGVRSVAPEAVMKVKYTNTWSSYNLEKQSARELIDDGCVIISQHSDTIGPAVACEECYPAKKIYHVGYNQSMIDVAPATSLVSTRINWEPYITGAVLAVLEGKDIEKCVDGNVHGNDVGAGFEKNWVQMMELNRLIAVDDTEEKIEQTIREFETKKLIVFKGDYTGVDPYDPTDTIDLKEGYAENAETSAPAFHYVLDNVIEIY